MVTTDVLASIALRYDTAMSRAMLRALGVPVPKVRFYATPAPAEDVTDPDVLWCFRNNGSPMDRMR